MRILKINKKFSVLCETKSTRSGFKHEATLMVNGMEMDFKAVQRWCNRTWEKYEYESVLQRLFETAGEHLEDTHRRAFKKLIKNGC